ncbi:hypothetical protein MMB19_28940 (plasmid) [Ralstonia insidiosa]|nr:hypothetical protein MMB19_28940 [Ralstonia insidiosa]
MQNDIAAAEIFEKGCATGRPQGISAHHKGQKISAEPSEERWKPDQHVVFTGRAANEMVTGTNMDEIDFSSRPWWRERDRMAHRFGLPDWAALESEMQAGGVLRSPGWARGDALTELWHAARIDAGFVILMREEGGVVGLAKTFGPDKVRAELQISAGVFDDSGGKYLAAVAPATKSVQAYADLSGARVQAAAVFAFASAASILCAVVLATLPVLPFLLLLLGFWTGGLLGSPMGITSGSRQGRIPLGRCAEAQ